MISAASTLSRPTRHIPRSRPRSGAAVSGPLVPAITIQSLWVASPRYFVRPPSVEKPSVGYASGITPGLGEKVPRPRTHDVALHATGRPGAPELRPPLSHPEHLLHLVAEMVDHLDAEAAGRKRCCINEILVFLVASMLDPEIWISASLLPFRMFSASRTHTNSFMSSSMSTPLCAASERRVAKAASEPKTPNIKWGTHSGGCPECPLVPRLEVPRARPHEPPTRAYVRQCRGCIRLLQPHLAFAAKVRRIEG